MKLPKSLWASVSLASGLAGAAELLYFSDDIEPRLCPPRYVARDGSFHLRVPAFGTAEKVFVEDRTITAGITSHVQFVVPKMGGVFIVSTKIRDDLSQAAALLRVEERRRAYAATDPESNKVSRTETKFGNTLSVVMLNTKTVGKSPPFPLAFDKSKESNETPGSASSHRFFVANGYFFEVAVLQLSGWQGASAKEDILKNVNDLADLIVDRMASPAVVCGAP